MTQTIHKSDTELRTLVTDELSYLAGLDAQRVDVSCSDGVVTLSGEVRSLPEQKTATHAASRVYGVKTVTDTMMVRVPEGYTTTDTDVSGAARRMLDWAVDVPAQAVKASVHDHQITLSGTVARQDQREAAARAVMYLKGVTGVINAIQLAAPPASSDAKPAIEAAFRRNAQLDSQTITVDHTDGEITLRGQVRSWSEWRQAGRLAWAAAGVTNVRNDLTFAP